MILLSFYLYHFEKLQQLLLFEKSFTINDYPCCDLILSLFMGLYLICINTIELLHS